MKSIKFGTFSGVFTPSILTILGVIMYLRLPWIAGQAGLYMTIGIILLAHLISVTTGLSVSSIATDKKVKAGGTYYMISRSLGLPIGGTLGLALFVGLSFSVSLYLIGFSESFLSYWGFNLDKDTIRLTGSIVLIAVTIITFISTSLAIKTQYLIMTAIFLSLISIFFGNHTFVPSEPLLGPTITAAPFIVLFGIFFPAVTGFEAGVSMSGDLKDPKKSIPTGTISAIVIGLVVYIFLAYFFSTSVSADLLENDPQALLKISWIPELVVAGIWGATLSSALGSILGAPRILQATAVDKITPRIFGKGVGETNEPRNAIILTFIIAEIGILIGELDVIARIVSMFFITTYGFLNLSCAIEKWASSDFHPEFKVPGVVSLIGSTACFIVMIQLDFVAMVGATIILGAVFLYLKRKELTLESGDTWESIWASLVRTGLTKLKGGTTSIRNWRPNIILFSGGLQTRPHLAEMGKAIAGKLGMISNFDLVEDGNAELHFGQGVETLENSSEAKAGIFTKQLSCKNIYEGINVITRIYGFTGIEPNTILMGWARNTRHPAKFAHLIKNLYELDYNSIFLDYDNEKGFGDRKKIDMWWSGAGNNLSFALTILRFIRSNDLWKESSFRILLINDDGSLTDKIFKNTHQALDQYRIEAEVKIINNGIENRKINDIIAIESSDADLTMLGISEENLSDPSGYIKKMNILMNELSTVMLLHSSSFFEEINVGIEKKSLIVRETEIARQIILPDIPVSKNTIINGEWTEIDRSVYEIISGFTEQSFVQITEEHNKLLTSIGTVVDRQLSALQKACSETDSPRFTKLLTKSSNDILFQINRLLIDHFAGLKDEEKNIIKDALEFHRDRTEALINKHPENLVVHFVQEELSSKEKEGLRIKLFKLRKRIISALTKKPVSIDVKFRKLLQNYLGKRSQVYISESLNNFGVHTCSFFSDLHSLITKVGDAFEKLSNLDSKKEISSEQIINERDSFEEKISEIKNNSSAFIQNLTKNLRKEWRKDLSVMNAIVEKPGVNFYIRKKLKQNKSEIQAIKYLGSYPYLWKKNYDLFVNSAELEGIILLLKGRIKSVRDNIAEKVNNELIDFNKSTEDIVVQIEQLNADKKSELKYSSVFEYSERFEHLLDDDFEDARNLALELPERVEITGEEFFTRVEEGKFKESDVATIQPRRLAEHLIESQFIEPIETKTNSVGEDLINSAEAIRETVNLINFNLENLAEDFQSAKVIETQRNKVINESIKKINAENEKIDKLSENFGKDLVTYLNNSLNPLSSHRIAKSSSELGHLIRETEGRKVISGVSRIRELVSKNIQKLIVNLVLGKSEGLILAKKFSTVDESVSTNIDSILNLIDTVSPDKLAFLQLPYYYKKLFSGTSHVSSDFWIGMKKELSEASKAVKRYRSGFTGGMLIIGERNCGKSTLSRIIASKYFQKDRIFTLKANKESTSAIEEFEKAVRKSFGLNGSLEEIFQSLPQNSVVVINDLELWWERSNEGFKVINLMADLIIKYSNRILFIVNCSVHSFRLINTIKKIDNLFISIIQCERFDAEDLKNVILLRHGSSGMKFMLGNTEEDSLNDLRTAALFNSYYNYSKGNVGLALNAWLSHITKVDGNVIIIKPPAEPDTNMLGNLDSEWFIYLAQIILHKRLSIEALAKLMITETAPCSKIVASLLRSGLIIEKIDGIYGINTFVEPYITKILEKKELI